MHSLVKDRVIPADSAPATNLVSEVIEEGKDQEEEMEPIVGYESSRMLSAAIVALKRPRVNPMDLAIFNVII